MKVRLGYACITNCINDSSSSPYTYSEYLKDGDIDIMLEAKGKDDSLFRLVRYIKYKTDYEFIDDTTFLV